MKKQERQTAIVSILRERADCSVTELSARFGVSAVTIRKDLTELEQRGALTRSYGKAAVLQENGPRAYACSVSPESFDDYQKMQTIGQLAAELVQDEDFLIIGPGYTCLEVAKNLRSKHRITVITTNISAAAELADAPEITLRIAPGDFTKRNGTYYVTGSATAEYLSQTYFDKIFITVDAVSLERGFFVLDEVTAQIFRAIMKPCSQVFICAVDAKFGKNALTPLGPVQLAAAVVTNQAPGAEFAGCFAAAGVPVSFPGKPLPAQEEA